MRPTNLLLVAIFSCAAPRAMQPAPADLDAPVARDEPVDAAAVRSAVAEISARHILVRVGDFPNGTHHTLAEAHRLIDQIRARVEAGEDFGALAKEFSEDPPTARRGGDLGSFARGTMVKSFDDAAFALPIGGYAVVETVFGVHLLSRTK